MNSELDPLTVRLEGIRKILVAHRDAGAALPSATKGSEREILIREFLASVFPSPFRFGSGSIVDASGAQSGQLDVVVEFPFLPSFPTPGAPERLYLADSVAAVLEVKSDLTPQWGELESTVSKVLALRRRWLGHQEVGVRGGILLRGATTSRIPVMGVAYKGPTTAEALQERLERTDEANRPDGLFVVESGAYSGCQLSPSTRPGTGAAGMLAFALDLGWLARNVASAEPDVSRYLGPHRS